MRCMSICKGLYMCIVLNEQGVRFDPGSIQLCELRGK
jgi:hypothetical protein